MKLLHLILAVLLFVIVLMLMSCVARVWANKKSERSQFLKDRKFCLKYADATAGVDANLFDKTYVRCMEGMGYFEQ